jgi:hypothetical protein
MIPRHLETFPEGYPVLGVQIAPLLAKDELHVAEAILGAVEFLADEAGPLWRDPRLYHAAITRALWVTGRVHEAEQFVRQGPYPSACVDAVWALCQAKAFHPIGVLLACSGALGLESWPSSGGRPVVRLRLDPFTLRDCAQSELLTRETLRPLLESSVILLGGTESAGVVALVLPPELPRPAPALVADARILLKNLAPQADLWWVS